MYNHSFGGGEGAYSTPMGSESSADINPEDIESVNMLTGPSAAALYGSDAANGVVIINTKRGNKDKQRLRWAIVARFRMLPLAKKSKQLWHKLGFNELGKPTKRQFRHC